VFFVEARYHRDSSRVGAQVHYISHREEGLVGGQRRELFGIGERYRALRGDESAIRKALRDDARGLRSPVFFRFILTVDNKAAERFSRLEGSVSERVLRDAIEKTFRGAVRGAQGIFSVHQHGGFDRPAHPHVHALLSPRFENGMAVHISPERIQRFRERWEREVLISLRRQDRRLMLLRELPVPSNEDRPRGRIDRTPPTLLPSRLVRARGQLELARGVTRRLRLLHGEELTRQLLPFARRAVRWERNPEQAARRAAFRLASRAMPAAIRGVLRRLRSLRERELRPR
jgi:hypothetical protein